MKKLKSFVNQTGMSVFHAAGMRPIRASAVAFIIVWLCVCAGTPAFGQTDQGSIVGTIMDSSGGVIPKAAVTLTNVDTGLVLNMVTGTSGVYTFSPVKIGNYRVSATAPGFGTTTQQNLHVNIQQRLEANLTLTVGGVSQTVEVTAAPTLVQAEDASVGQEYLTKTINDTPLNGRNYVYIAQLTAGIVPTTGSRGGGSGDFSANGQASTQNNFILNGVDNNVSVVDYLNQASYNVKPPTDALSEFKVQTANYSAEFGHSSGSVVNASIKSGTNKVHGDVWEFFRNTALNAKDWTFTSVAPYHQNQFGATLGLPIVKNKLFFFGDWEDSRIHTLDPSNKATVPTAKMRTGDFSDLLDPVYTGAKAIQLYEPGTHTAIPGNRLDLDPALKLNPTALKILNLYPCPNTTSAAGATVNCVVNRPVIDNTFSYDTRMDYNVGSNDQIFASFSHSNHTAYHTPPLGNILDGGAFYDTGPQNFLSHNFAASHTHVFTSTLTNEFRVGFNYGHFTLQQPNANTNVAADLGLGGIPFGKNLGGLPTITMNLFGSIRPAQNNNGVGGAFPFGTWFFMYTTERQYISQILDNVTKIWGKHTLRAGVSIHYIRFSTFQPQYQRGAYTFNGVYTGGADGTLGSGVADFLLGQVNAAGLSSLGKSDNLRWDNGAFIQDDWKITRRMTLNLGLRWEDPTSFKDMKARMANFVPNSTLGVNSGTATYLLPTQPDGKPVDLGPNFLNIVGSRVNVGYTDNQYLVNDHWANFAPRLGLAYRLSDRGVLRMGYGLFFGGLAPIGYGPSPGADFPFLPTSNFTAASCSGPGNCPVVKSNLGNPITLEKGFVDPLSTGLIAAVTSPTVNGIQADTKAAYSENYNVSAEYLLTKEFALTVGYVGTQAHKLQGGFNVNNAYALQRTGSNINAMRAFPGLGNITVQQYVGQNAYNSLQSTLQKRLSHGLTFAANFTHSHQIAIGAPVSPIVPAKTNVTSTISDRFTLNGNYALPFGIGKTFAKNSKVLDYFIGGWAMSFTYVAQTGTPFSVATTNGAGFSPAVGATATPLLVGDPFVGGGTPPAGSPATSCPATVHTLSNWYNPCAFINPLSGNNIPAGTTVTGDAALPYFGNLRPTQIYGPGNARVNASLFKNFVISEARRVEFRADAFNVMNHASWSNPSDTGISSSGGKITSSVPFQTNTPDARFFQLSMKLYF